MSPQDRAYLFVLALAVLVGRQPIGTAVAELSTIGPLASC